jgi:5-deoxy-D-glucuronate isomerase
MAMCKCDESFMEEGRKYSKFTDLKQVAHITCVSINVGALLDVAGDIELRCCIDTTHGMMAMCKCDESSREGRGKLSIVTDLKQLTHIHCVSINFGALLTVVGDLELVCCIPATHGMMTVCKCDESFREVGRKSSKPTDLKQVAHINCVSINFGSLLDVIGDIELRCCIDTTHGMMVMCKVDESSRQGVSKLSIVTDLKQFTHIHCVCIIFGALLAVVGDLELACCITTTHGMMVMCKCDESFREVGRKPSNFTDLKQVVHTNCVSINSGALLTVADDLERKCCIAAPYGMFAMCKIDESSREGGRRLSKFTDLKQFTHINCVSINFGALLTVTGDLELGCCITVTHGMMTMCKCDESFRDGGRKSSKFTDLKEFVLNLASKVRERNHSPSVRADCSAQREGERENERPDRDRGNADGRNKDHGTT